MINSKKIKVAAKRLMRTTCSKIFILSKGATAVRDLWKKVKHNACFSIMQYGDYISGMCKVRRNLPDQCQEKLYLVL